MDPALLARYDLRRPPPDCPACNGQREWGRGLTDGMEADCFFCGRTALVAPPPVHPVVTRKQDPPQAEPSAGIRRAQDPPRSEDML
jgi:hypothetical protein